MRADVHRRWRPSCVLCVTAVLTAMLAVPLDRMFEQIMNSRYLDHLGYGKYAPDLDDAAATAARYLCASGHDLDSGTTWASAIHSYNHAQEYVDAVHAAATAYAQRAAR